MFGWKSLFLTRICKTNKQTTTFPSLFNYFSFYCVSPDILFCVLEKSRSRTCDTNTVLLTASHLANKYTVGEGQQL